MCFTEHTVQMNYVFPDRINFNSRVRGTLVDTSMFIDQTDNLCVSESTRLCKPCA